MARQDSFYEILTRKLSSPMIENETKPRTLPSREPDFSQAPLMDQRVFRFSRAKSSAQKVYSAHKIKKNRQEFDIAQQTSDPSSLKSKSERASNHSSVSDGPFLPNEELFLPTNQLSSLGAVAFRTLLKHSDTPLPSQLTPKVLKKIKRTLVKRLHPDRGGAPEALMATLEALEILSQEVLAHREQNSHR